MVRWLFRVTRNDDSAWPSNDEQFTIDVSEGVYLGDVIQCTGTLQSASEIDFGDKIVSTIGEDSNAKYLLAVPYSNGTYLSVEEILYDDADIQITDMRSSLSTNKCIITKTNTGTLRNYVALLPGFANDYKGSLLYEGNIAININIDAIYNESSETIPFNGQRNYILTIPGAGSHITGMSGGE